MPGGTDSRRASTIERGAGQDCPSVALVNGCGHKKPGPTKRTGQAPDKLPGKLLGAATPGPQAATGKAPFPV